MSKLDRIDPNRLRGNPRATYPAWLYYEPMIVAAVRSFPRPYTFSPQNMKASSVCSKARDAVRGMIAFRWPTEKITAEELERWYSQVIFKNDDTTVYIGSPKDFDSSKIEGQETKPVSPNTLAFDTLAFEEIVAFTLLLSNTRIKGPVIIRHPPDLSLLPPRDNVELLPRQDGSLVLL